MNRLVYLFELDSVVKWEHSGEGVLFTPGVKALFSEIIHHGNCVAITMNQLTDSQFIREAMESDVAYAGILRLFERGTLKVSLYNEIRTASQYIQNAIDKCLAQNRDSFIFSNLPVKSEESELLATIRSALQFSDLSALKERMLSAKGSEADRLQSIYRFVNMILKVSISETSNIPPKRAEKRSFEEFVATVISLLGQEKGPQGTLLHNLKKAAELLKEKSKSVIDGRNNRSNWLFPEKGAAEDALLANDIINLCYNYAVEDSINGVSKHYNETDFENSFAKDFFHRLTKKSPSKPNSSVTGADWNTVLRFADYREKMKQKKDEEESFVYEENFRRERRNWVRFLFFQNIGAFFISFVYICIFLLVEFFTSKLESLFSLPIDNALVASAVTLLLFGVFGSLIGKVLKFFNHKQDMPDVLECLFNIWFRFCDFWRAVGGKNDSYKLP